jgi:hypothetical protein
MFEVTTPIWLSGTVTRYEAIAPHAMIQLEVTTADGAIEAWTVEGPFPGRLNRILAANPGMTAEGFIQVGDAIEVCGFALKAEIVTQRPNNQFVHGHVLVMPGGRMQSWGPYGHIYNCFRPDDELEPWVEFLNEDLLARGFWCGSRGRVSIASTVPDKLVGDINSQVENPCD